MSMAPQASAPQASPALGHPNEIDLLRITRAIGQRLRYRYVTPAVSPVCGGYLVRSACCSRNVDADGGEIDVARILWCADPVGWLLYAKDHATGRWVEDSLFHRLPELLARLNSDPDRRFWQ
ncbi:MAG TPA: DUF3024 domain-containing protein [Novosphingobium sp.]|nr:DUF3024 domain-containing protein [Novosphingobium sp.]